MKEKITSKTAPKATGPFSHAIKTDGLIFVGGQIYLNSEGKLIEGSVEDKINQIMHNLRGILEEAGASFADVVKTTIYVTDMSIYVKINEVYGTYMSEPYPAREVVCVKDLPLGAIMEISMIAKIN